MNIASHPDQSAAHAFITRWRGVQASELATAQSFVIDLCALLGVDKPHPTLEQDYMFERPVWLGAATPPLAKPRRAIVVMDDSANDSQPLSLTEILARARGSLGHASREAVLADLARSLQAWDR